MAKPNTKPTTIIYSNRVFNALCLELNPDGGGVPAGARAKVGGLSLAWTEEPLEIGPLQVPEAGVAISEPEVVWKVRAGSSDVAPIAYAHGCDMAKYKTIVFDLDFPLTTQAIHRIVELNFGVTGDGRCLAPVTWRTLAAQDHLILLVLAGTVDLDGSPDGQKHLRLGARPITHRVTTSYDLIHELPFKFNPLQDFGRALAPDNYALDDEDKKLRSALKPWMNQGIAFRVLDSDRTPVAVKQSSFCSIPSEGPPLTIAGAFRYEKSLLAFLPATSLDPISWLKKLSEISEVLNARRRSSPWLSNMADSSVLDKIVLIVRPVESRRRGNPVSLSIEFNGTEFPVKVPSRTGRKASNFNQDHQWLIHLSKEHPLLSVDDMIDMVKVAAGKDWTVDKVSQLMTALRKGVGLALVDAGLPKGLAVKMFPEDMAGVSNKFRRENIRVPEPPAA